MIKNTMLAAVSLSVLALYSTSASAQATTVYGSPGQARTYDETQAYNARGVLSSQRLDRMVRQGRGFEPFAAAPYGFAAWPATSVQHKHTDVADY
jgi:hypothetical protein